MIPGSGETDLWARAEHVHSEHGLDWSLYLDAYLCGKDGLLVRAPRYLLLAHDDPRNDAWVVWWLDCLDRRSGAELLRLMLKHMPHYRSKVCWSRGLKSGQVRFYSTERLLRFTKD